jgi:hypothetical protein
VANQGDYDLLLVGLGKSILKGPFLVKLLVYHKDYKSRSID